MITSNTNPSIKKLKSLQRSRNRRSEKLFVIEGLLEIERAVAAGYDMRTVFYCPDLISESEVYELIKTNKPGQFEAISHDLFNQLAYRGGSGGLMVTASTLEHPLSAIKTSDNDLILVLESVEKPGNLGAILRTADAAGVSALILCDQHSDIYNPNVIRSSIGCLFSVPIALSTSEEVIQWLQKEHVSIFCSALSASKPHHDIDFTQKCAIVMGTESTGLSNKWLEASDQNIIIPMFGVADSLNVSTSTAILTFEAIRQRTT